MSDPSTITCKRCGNCCKADLFAYITDEDLERWRREGRKDILHVLENRRPFWAGDRIVSGASGRPLYSCPFFTWDGHLATCTIHDTRPKICRDYMPGSNALCSQFSHSTKNQ